MESRVADCAALHAKGYNCAQAVACAYADLVGADKQALFAATEGLGLGMGCMEGTCGALSGACIICGLAKSGADLDNPTTKGATYKVSRQIVEQFAEVCGATRCRDLKGIDTGEVLCSCPQCIENAARILENVAFAE